MQETKGPPGQIEDNIQQCPLIRLNGSEMLIRQRLMILHHYFDSLGASMACKCKASEKCSSRLINIQILGSYLMSYLSLNCGMTIEINLLELCREIYQNSNSLTVTISS